jgi:hypothetical protein
MLGSPERCLQSVVYVYFFIGIVDMGLYGVQAEKKFIRDILVGGA